MLIFHEFSELEKVFFLRLRAGHSKLNVAMIAILLLVGGGIIVNLLGGFYLPRDVKTISWEIGVLILVSILYLAARAESEE